MNFRWACVHISRKLRKRNFWRRTRGNACARKEAVATRFRVRAQIASLIYQFGSNVNNRAIARTQYRNTNSTGLRGLSFQETRSTDHVRRARKFSRGRPLSGCSTRRVNTCTFLATVQVYRLPQHCQQVPDPEIPAYLSRHFYLASLRTVTGSDQSFLFFFHRALTYVSRMTHFISQLKSICPFFLSL